jgi:hypothetical protein
MIKEYGPDTFIWGIDFDETLCYGGYPDIKKGKQKWIHKLIMNFLKWRQNKGAYIILITCRSDTFMETGEEKKTGNLKEAIIFLQNRGFVPNQFNENAPWLISKYGDCRKISVCRMIDDNGMGVVGWILRYYKKKLKNRNI